MIVFTRKIVLFLFLMIFDQLKGQQYEWVKFFQGRSTQAPVSSSVDQNGYQYATFYYYTEVIFDSMTVNAVNQVEGLVIKKAPDGRTVWHKILRSGGTVFPVASTFNRSGNLLLIAASNSYIHIGTDTVFKRSNSSSTDLFMLELNDTGKIVKGRHLIQGTITSAVYAMSNLICTDADYNIYLAPRFGSNITVYDTAGSRTINTAGRHIVLRFSEGGDSLIWSNILSSNIYVNSIKVDKDKQVYLASYWSGSNNIFFNGTSIAHPYSGRSLGSIFILTPSGSDKNYFTVPAGGSGNLSTILDLAVYDSSSVFISGAYFGDSVLFGSTWYPNNLRGGYTFFAKFSQSGVPDWVKIEDTSYFYNYQQNYYGSMNNFKDQYVYLSVYSTPHYLNRPFIYDGQRYSANVIGNGLNMKFDNRGNILWAFKTFMPFKAMGTDNIGNLYFQGWWYNDTIKLGPFQAKGNLYDSYMGKTFDYAIVRGEVQKGPYCAGDTFLIPYTKQGVFADTNTFYAELSDEFGEFTGRERVLGKISTPKDSTITGILPLFQVVSSEKYRIRIRSTSPQVQSFYRLDTLKLLIYSRDKADPGPPETICKGDTVMLNTYGGTTWQWSPAYRMDDSTRRQPMVWPDSSFTYRIVIGDSSGCGAPDTAFKTIRVRSLPEVRIAAPDTSYCQGADFNISAFFSGGDSTYHWEWFAVDRDTNWISLRKSGQAFSDTLHEMIPAYINDHYDLAIVLTDSCSDRVDTAYHRLRISRHIPQAAVAIKDTAICPTGSVSLKAIFTDSLRVSAYRWMWFTREDSGAYVLSGTDSGGFMETFEYSLPETVREQTQIMLVFRDYCSPVYDTLLTRVRPRDPIRIQGDFRDTTVCRGAQFNTGVSVSGGVPEQYRYQWKLDTSVYAQTDSIVFLTEQSLRVTLTAGDGCMPQGDTVAFELTVLPALETEMILNGATLNDLTLCLGENVTVHQISAGGMPGAYRYQWLVNGWPVSTDDSFTFIPALYHPPFSDTTATVRLDLVLSDGCTVPDDTASVLIHIRPALKVTAFATDSLCVGQTGISMATGRGGNGNYSFTWLDSSGNVISLADSLKPAHMNPDFYGDYSHTVVLEDGCTAEGDTARLNTFMISRPELTLDHGDTSVCIGQVVTFKAGGRGGKNHQYTYSWYTGGMPASAADSLVVEVFDTLDHYVVLSDGCSQPEDTIRFRTANFEPLRLSVFAGMMPTGDTVICYGTDLRWDFRAQGGDASMYVFSAKLDGVERSASDSFVLENAGIQAPSTYIYNLNDTGSHILEMILHDGCSREGDTLTIRFIILPPLVIDAALPDSICYGNTVLSEILAAGGDGSYSYNWYDSSLSVLSAQSTFNLIHDGRFGTGLKRFYASVLDNCPEEAGVMLQVMLLPPLTQTLSAADICVAEEAELGTVISGGRGEGYTVEWFANDMPVAGDSNRLSFPVDGTVTFKTVVQDGCSSASDTASVRVGQVPRASVDVFPDSACAPADIEFTLRPENYTATFWDLITGDGKVYKDLPAALPVRTHLYTGASVYLPSVRISSTFGCSDSFALPVISIFPKPVALFDHLPLEPTLDEPEVTFTNKSSGSVGWNWNFNGQGASTARDPRFIFTDTGRTFVTLIAVSDRMCQDTFTAYFVLTANYKLFIPTAFSPDDNGHNDLWIPFTSGVSELQFTVWNRWGEKIYIGDQDHPWDGTYQGKPVPQGMYMYQLEVRTLQGYRYFHDGTITLLR